MNRRRLQQFFRTTTTTSTSSSSSSYQNTIKTDYRSLQQPAAIIHSTWTPTLRRCTNPVQLRITISRIFAISSKNQPPLHIDIIAALDACARIAMIGSGGYAPILIGNQLPNTSVNKIHYFQQQGFESAQTIMHTIATLKIMPSTSIYAAYIRVCAHACQVNAAFLAFNDMKRRGLTPDLEVFKGLIMAAAMHGDLNKALSTINLSVSHTSLIVKHATKLKLALRFVAGLEIGKFMGVCASIYAGISQIHAQMIGVGFGVVFGVRFCIPILINMHAGTTTTTENSPTTPGHLSAKYQKPSSNPSSSFYSLDAKEVNEHMHYFLLGLLEQSHNVDGIIQVLKAMEVHGLKISSKTYTSLVSELVVANKPDLALQVIQKVYTTDDQLPLSVFVTILQHYYDRNEFQKAIDVYEQYMTSLQLNTNAYTTLISAFGKVNNVDKAMYFYDRFLKDGFSPNRFVLNTLISILAMNGKYRLAEEVVLVTMTKYEVYPSLRSFCKLIEKARSITPDQYAPPPLSSQFTPPELPAQRKHNFPVKDTETPIQVQRAWYWYHRSLSSGLVNNYIPVTFLMLVMNVFGYAEPAVLEYAQSLRPHANQPLLPMTRRLDSGIALLVPKEIPFEQGPLVLTYFTVIRSCTRSTSIPFAYALGVLYDAKARQAWQFPLPPPTSNLVPLVTYIETQMHTNHAAQINPRSKPTWYNICQRSSLLLQGFVHRCLVDRDVDRDLNLLVSQITHMFLLNVCGTQPGQDSNPLSSDDTRTSTSASGHSSTRIFGPPDIIDDDDEDEVVVFNHSSVPFKPVRPPSVVKRIGHNKRPPGFAFPASAKRDLAAGDFRALKTCLKQLDHNLGITRSNNP